MSNSTPRLSRSLSDAPGKWRPARPGRPGQGLVPVQQVPALTVGLQIIRLRGLCPAEVAMVSESMFPLDSTTYGCAGSGKTRTVHVPDAPTELSVTFSCRPLGIDQGHAHGRQAIVEHHAAAG